MPNETKTTIYRVRARDTATGLVINSRYFSRRGPAMKYAASHISSGAMVDVAVTKPVTFRTIPGTDADHLAEVLNKPMP